MVARVFIDELLLFRRQGPMAVALGAIGPARRLGQRRAKQRLHLVPCDGVLLQEDIGNPPYHPMPGFTQAQAGDCAGSHANSERTKANRTRRAMSCPREMA